MLWLWLWLSLWLSLSLSLLLSLSLWLSLWLWLWLSLLLSLWLLLWLSLCHSLSLSLLLSLSLSHSLWLSLSLSPPHPPVRHNAPRRPPRDRYMYTQIDASIMQTSPCGVGWGGGGEERLPRPGPIPGSRAVLGRLIAAANLNGCARRFGESAKEPG